MDSILQGTAASLRVTFTVDGVATDPLGNAATVTIRRSDGTVLVDADDATRIAAGVYGFTVDPSQTQQLDVLTAAWTGTLEGQAQTVVTRAEIVGGFYFTVAEFKAAYSDDDEVQALDADKIAAARAVAEEIIEGLEAADGAHVAFVPRAETFRLSGNGRTRISIPRYRLRTVETLSIDGVDSDVSGVVIESSSLFVPHWPAGFSNVVAKVTHGYDQPPGRIKDAAILLTYHRLIKGPIDDRAVSVPDAGGGVISLATPGRAGYITGIPEVDAAIQQYAKKRPRVRSIVTTDRGNDFPASDWLSRYA